MTPAKDPAPLVDILELFDSPRQAGGLALGEGLELALSPVPGMLVEELRTAHHLLARTLAEGKNPKAAAAACGMSVQRVQRLLQDPAFKDLLEYYKTQMDDLFAAVQDRLAALGLTFLDVLQERAIDSPEKFTNRELMEFANGLLEKTVAPPKAPKGMGGGSPIGISIQFVRPEHDGPTITVRPEQSDPLGSLE